MDIKKLLGNRPFDIGDDGTLICCNCRGYSIETECEQCNEKINSIFWIIVDGEKRPDLLQQIVEGKLHDPVCPRCNYRNHLEINLLLFHPNKKPVLVFSPTKDTTPEECKCVGMPLLLKLKQQLGDNWQDEWYYTKDGRGIFIVERIALPIFIKKMWRIK